MKIIVQQILEFYDEPQLYTAKDEFGALYLCLYSAIEDRYDCTAVKVTPRRLAQYMAREVDLRSIYLNPEDGAYFSVTSPDDETLEINPLPADCLTEERLPAEGFYFLGDFSAEDEALIMETQEQGRRVYHLGVADESNSHSISPRVLTKILSGFEGTIEGIVTSYHKKQTVPLQLFATSAASFNLHFTIGDKLDWFGYSNIDFALRRFEEILAAGNVAELQRLTSDLKVGAVQKIKEFVGVLEENNYLVKSRWIDAEGCKTGKAKITRNQVAHVHEILTSSEFSGEKEVVFEGFFEAVSLKNSNWILQPADSSGAVGGKAPEKNLLKSIVMGDDAHYRIVCKMKEERNLFSDKSKFIYELLSVEAID